VRAAFNLFATGEYTETTLREELVAPGFTMPKTLKQPERPISRATVAKLLRDRYYLARSATKASGTKAGTSP